MTHDEGVAWLARLGGRIAQMAADPPGGEVRVTIHDVVVRAFPKDMSNAEEVRRSELEAIEEFKQILEN